jgi:hypothetical protein
MWQVFGDEIMNKEEWQGTKRAWNGRWAVEKVSEPYEVDSTNITTA